MRSFAMRWGPPLILVCCLLYVSVILVPTGVYAAMWPVVFGDKAADWVQAFGSIAAILGAWLLGSRQARHERHLEEDRRKAVAEEERRRTEKRDRRAIDAMMFAWDVVNNVADHLGRSSAERPLDVGQMLRWIGNADDQMSFHAAQPRDWGDLTVSIFAARRYMPNIVLALGAYNGDGETSATLKAALNAAIAALKANINDLEPDRDYVPFHKGLAPKYLSAWPSGDAQT
jgi:hypothetical protein